MQSEYRNLILDQMKQDLEKVLLFDHFQLPQLCGSVHGPDPSPAQLLRHVLAHPPGHAGQSHFVSQRIEQYRHGRGQWQFTGIIITFYYYDHQLTL